MAQAVMLSPPHATHTGSQAPQYMQNAANILHQQLLLQHPKMKKLSTLDEKVSNVLAMEGISDFQKIEHYLNALQEFMNLRNDVIRQGSMAQPQATPAETIAMTQALMPQQPEMPIEEEKIKKPRRKKSVKNESDPVSTPTVDEKSLQALEKQLKNVKKSKDLIKTFTSQDGRTDNALWSQTLEAMTSKNIQPTNMADASIDHAKTIFDFMIQNNIEIGSYIKKFPVFKYLATLSNEGKTTRRSAKRKSTAMSKVLFDKWNDHVK